MKRGDEFTHPLEKQLALNVRQLCCDLPNGSPLTDSQLFRAINSNLEYYIPSVLREVHGEWEFESLDGVLPEFVLKTGELRLQTAGLCILITDQTITPFHVQLRVKTNADEIAWFICQLGEIRDGQMIRIPYDTYFRSGGVRQVRDRLNTMSWRYHVGFGDADGSGSSAR